MTWWRSAAVRSGFVLVGRRMGHARRLLPEPTIVAAFSSSATTTKLSPPRGVGATFNRRYYGDVRIAVPPNKKGDVFWIAAVATGSTLMLWSAATTATACEADAASTRPPSSSPAERQWQAAASTSDNNSNDDERREQDQTPDFPMYDNLPDEDVETDCFLCRTHRQGPCRRQWRNFEYCAKDHPDNGGTACSPYVQPFQDCWMKHLNLYLLIAMTLNGERIHEIQRQHAADKANSQRRKGLQHVIKWDEWNALFEQEGFLDSVAQVRAVFDQFEKTMPLWQVYDTLKEDPFVVNVECRVPTRRKDGRILKVCYALDQDDRAVGLADYDKSYEIEKAAVEGRGAPDLDHCRMVLSLVPGATEAIQIKALYVPPNDADEDVLADEDNEDAEPEGVATEDLDIVRARRPKSSSHGSVLVESLWVPLPGLAGSSTELP